MSVSSDILSSLYLSRLFLTPLCPPIVWSLLHLSLSLSFLSSLTPSLPQTVKRMQAKLGSIVPWCLTFEGTIHAAPPDPVLNGGLRWTEGSRPACVVVTELLSDLAAIIAEGTSLSLLSVCLSCYRFWFLCLLFAFVFRPPIFSMSRCLFVSPAIDSSSCFPVSSVEILSLLQSSSCCPLPPCLSLPLTPPSPIKSVPRAISVTTTSPSSATSPS